MKGPWPHHRLTLGQKGMWLGRRKRLTPRKVQSSRAESLELCLTMQNSPWKADSRPPKPCSSFLSVFAVLSGRIMLDLRAVASGKAHHHTSIGSKGYPLDSLGPLPCLSTLLHHPPFWSARVLTVER